MGTSSVCLGETFNWQCRHFPVKDRYHSTMTSERLGYLGVLALQRFGIDLCVDKIFKSIMHVVHLFCMTSEMHIHACNCLLSDNIVTDTQ